MAKLAAPFFKRAGRLPARLNAVGPSTRLIQESIYFDSGVVADTVYKGPSLWNTRYLGVRSDAQLYLGIKILHV